MSKVLRHRLLGGRDEKVPELLTSSEKCATIDKLDGADSVTAKKKPTVSVSSKLVID